MQKSYAKPVSMWTKRHPKLMRSSVYIQTPSPRSTSEMRMFHQRLRSRKAPLAVSLNFRYHLCVWAIWRKHNEWMRDVNERQRNFVFPDMARNLGEFW